MKNTNKDVFIRQQVAYKANAKYKLVVYFKDCPLDPPKVFFSCERLDKKGELGYKKLEALVTVKYAGLFATAIIYNNQTGEGIAKWVQNKYYDEKRA